MPSTRITRAASNARADILDQLREDHKRVKKAYRAFQKLDTDDDTEVEAIVQEVLAELTVHAALEEELLYPAARAVVDDEVLIDEAEVEHESLHTLIAQLRRMSPGDDKYVARFTVLCEYVLHHVKEEESEMFPQLEKARLNWEELALQMNDRRAEMTIAEGAEGSTEAAGEDEEADPVGDGGRPSRSTSRSRVQPA